MNFKELFIIVWPSSDLDTKCPRFFQVTNVQHFWQWI